MSTREHSVESFSPAAGPALDSGDRGPIDRMLTEMVRHGGSDLHVTVGRPPMIRVHGDLTPLPGYSPLQAQDADRLVRSVVDDAQWARFEFELELDVAYSLPDVARFRMNIFRQRNSLGAVVRAVPHEIERPADLGLPSAVAAFAHLPAGLVIVAGPTGAGKSTTLASLLDLANRTRHGHIVTIEDPIEFLHRHDGCVVNQRELGADTRGFSSALERALRQDPDIVYVSELCDPQTVAIALTAAQAGRLVFTAVRAQSADEAIEQLVDMFPARRRREVRAQLSSTLQGVVVQGLARRADGSGRTVVCEVMTVTAGIRTFIRAGRVDQIPALMRAADSDALLPFDAHLAQRVAAGVITYEEGLALSRDAGEYCRLAGRHTLTP